MRKKRSLLCILLAAALTLGLLIPTVSASETSASENAYLLWSLGLAKGDANSNGYSESTMELGRTATRLEAVVILLRLLGREDAALKANYGHSFSDVPGWGSAYVGYAARQELVKGVGGGRFGASDPISLRDFTTLMLRALNYQDAAGDFSWQSAKDKAVELGIYSRSFADRDGNTRGDLFTVAVSVLSHPQKNSSVTLADRLAYQGVIPLSAVSGGKLVSPVSTPVPSQGSVSQDVLLAFQEKMNSGNYDRNRSLLADVTGDGIPELFLVELSLARPFVSANVDIFIYSGGTLKKADIAVAAGTSMSEEWNAYLCKVNGQFCILGYVDNEYTTNKASWMYLSRLDANGREIILDDVFSTAKIQEYLKDSRPLAVTDWDNDTVRTFTDNELAAALSQSSGGTSAPSTPTSVPAGVIEVGPLMLADGYNDATRTLSQAFGVPMGYNVAEDITKKSGIECYMYNGAVDTYFITSSAYSVEGIRVGMTLDEAKTILNRLGAGEIHSKSGSVSYKLPDIHGFIPAEKADWMFVGIDIIYNSNGQITQLNYYITMLS